MKSLISFWMVMMVSAAMYGQAQTNFLKSITCDNNNQNIVFVLAGNVSVSEWDENYIRINCTIEVTNSSEAVLTRLFTLGRYNLEVKNEGNQIHISAPKMANHIAIQGTDLLENMHYEINIPRGMTFKAQPVHYSNVLQAI